MLQYTLTLDNGWVEVSDNALCRIQLLSSWHPGVVRIHVGTVPPDDSSPYFELGQGDMFLKTSLIDKVYVYAPHAHKDNNPAIITVSDNVDALGGAGGGGGAGDASAANQSVMIARLNSILSDLQNKADKTEEQPVSVTHGATYLRQDAMITLLTSIINELSTKANLSQTQPVSIVNVATESKQDAAIAILSNVLSELSLKTDATDTQPVSATSLPLPTGAATALRQVDIINALLDVITAIGTRTSPSDAQEISWPSVEYTPGLTRTSAVGVISSGKHSVSIANLGAGNGTVLGTVIKPGEVIAFEPSNVNATLGAISYSGLGTELLISMLTPP